MYWKVPLYDAFSETAMGKKIYAQSNSDSEYVKNVYKWVIFIFFFHICNICIQTVMS